MPKKGIIRNIDDFARQLVEFYSGGDGLKHLEEAFLRAEKLYHDHGYLRRREEHFIHALNSLKKFPDPLNRLLIIEVFLSEGGWERNSANTYFLLELINGTGYERLKEVKHNQKITKETDEYLHKNVAEPLQQALKDLINKHANEQDQVLREAESARRELEKLRRQGCHNNYQNEIVLCKSHEEAHNRALENFTIPVFALFAQLTDQTKTWQLRWYDLQGQGHYLPMNYDMRKLLMPLQELPAKDSLLYEEILNHCSKLLPDYTMTHHTAIYFFNDAVLACQFARQQPDKYSFHLTPAHHAFIEKANPQSGVEQPTKWQLTWFDYQGKPELLIPEGELARLLATHSTLPSTYTREHYRLKTACAKFIDELVNGVQVIINPHQGDALGYHLQLHTIFISDEAIKPNQLYCYLMNDNIEYALLDYQGQIIRQALVPEEYAEYASLHEQLSQATPLLLPHLEHSLVKTLAANGYKPFKPLTFSFVLTGLAPAWQLLWFDSLGVCQTIKLKNYPQLANWLDQIKTIKETDLLTLKNYLFHLNNRHSSRREVDYKKQDKIAKVLEQKHGLTLIIANKIEEIPPYKRLAGTYFLTCPEGCWQLHQQQRKDSKKLLFNAEDKKLLNTDDWESFHDLLDQHAQLSPAALEKSEGIKNQLRDIITKSMKSLLTTVAKIEGVSSVKRLDMVNYKDVIECLNKRFNPSASVDAEQIVLTVEQSQPLVQKYTQPPKKLDFQLRAKVAGLFGEKLIDKEQVVKQDKQPEILGDSLDIHLFNNISLEFN